MDPRITPEERLALSEDRRRVLLPWLFGITGLALALLAIGMYAVFFGPGATGRGAVAAGSGSGPTLVVTPGQAPQTVATPAPSTTAAPSGAGPSGKPTTVTTPAPPPVITIAVSDDSQYSPHSVNVPAGTNITWTNNGESPRSIESSGGGGPNSLSKYPSGIPIGQSYTWKVPSGASSGTSYAYTDRVVTGNQNGHLTGEGMSASITVE
jgi:hypothetical protein